MGFLSNQYTKMKNKLLTLLCAITASNFMAAQGFPSPALQWNIPAVLDTYEEQVNYTLHAVIDMNGDGKPDLVDSENSATENVSDVFYNGNQKYWKVYLSTGSGFSPTAIQWNIPATLDSYEEYVNYNNHVVIDMNGDGKPDLVDSEDEATAGAQVFYNGNQKYWKVYLNTGSGFSATPIQWNIPAVLDTYEEQVNYTLHAVIDMNGDGKPDLVDSENSATETVPDVFYNGNQKYWKVYLNTGSGFSPTALQWNIPPTLDSYEEYVNYNNHVVIDMNGDGKPDLVDSEDEATSGAQLFFNGNQKYWKVYLNTGSGFSPTSIQWNMPATLDTYEEQVNYTLHAVIDMNGDGKPDLVDSEDEATSDSQVFYNGSQKHWKVYVNTGSGFSPTALQWNIPQTLDTYEEYVNYNNHVVLDMNGDGKPDLIDSENEATNNTADVFYNGNQKYWKVYLNSSPLLAVTTFENDNSISVFPNPASDKLQIVSDESIENVSIFNLLGQQVLMKYGTSNEVFVDVSNLTVGTYIVKVTANQSVKTLKIIKK